MKQQLVITPQDLDLQNLSPRYPHKVKTYKHYYINQCNLLFSQNKLIAFVKHIVVNGVIVDLHSSFYYFTDENVCKRHLAWAKKDLEKYCEPDKDKFNKKIKKVLFDNFNYKHNKK